MKKILAYIFATPFCLGCLFVLLYPIIGSFLESAVLGFSVLGIMVLFFAGLYSVLYLIHEHSD